VKARREVGSRQRVEGRVGVRAVDGGMEAPGGGGNYRMGG
jgi:hypothetical protein